MRTNHEPRLIRIALIAALASISASVPTAFIMKAILEPATEQSITQEEKEPSEMAVIVTTEYHGDTVHQSADSFEVNRDVLYIIKEGKLVAAYSRWESVRVEKEATGAKVELVAPTNDFINVFKFKDETN